MPALPRRQLFAVEWSDVVERPVDAGRPATDEPERRHRRLATLWEIERGLPSVLAKLALDPGRWILILEDATRTNRYVQFLAFEDGSLVAETVSNVYLTGEDRWTVTDEAALAALGWEPPEPPRRPNWIVVSAEPVPPVEDLAARAVRTWREVAGLGDRGRLVVELFDSPRRGSTPATVDGETPDGDPSEAGEN